MLREGEVFVYGLTKDNARALLAAADEVKADPHSVRAIDIGFICPEVVYDAATSLHPPIIEGLAPDATF
jgi:hypothetical protein